MKYIKLNKGKYAIIDNEDFEYLSQWKWYIGRNGHYPFTEYAKRNRHIADKSKEIFMHRVILEKNGVEIEGKLVDHINHNGLDNRKENMRTATRSENKTNGIRYSNNTSGTKGIYFENSDHFKLKKWKAAISINGKWTNLGRFITKEEAIKVRKKAENKYFGEFAYQGGGI